MAELIFGLGELRSTFANRKVDIKDRSAVRIVAAGARVLKKEAKAIVQAKGLIRSRALINNIAVKRERNTATGIEQYNLGVRHGREMGNGKKVIKYLALNSTGRIVTRRMNDPYYWRFLELGHRTIARASGLSGTVTRRSKDGKLRKRGADSISERRRSPTGFVDATPFIRPALENKKLEALAAMEQAALKLLDATK
jgi:HK97 gp10 family phage protein